MNKKRVRKLNEKEFQEGDIIYWMSRDQRVKDNWALIYAYNLARDLKSKLKVVFTLDFSYPLANYRSFSFMIDGLRQVQNDLYKLNIPFIMLLGNPLDTMQKYISENDIAAIIDDFDPLKVKQLWKKQIAEKINVPFYEVDTHNIVPAFYVTDKQEFAAYTLRPKLHKLMSEFLEEFPKLDYYELNGNIEKIDNFSHIDYYLKKVEYLEPVQFRSGEKAAFECLDHFIKNKIHNYSKFRNNPSLDYQSNLSPYLHFGQISSQRVVSEIISLDNSEKFATEFIEEIFIRRELSDNFCLYNQHYDKFDGFPTWAKETLNKHRNDRRQFIYSLTEFENAQTHDQYWNAAQTEMVRSGKMHGYMRMYWCKKILEWTTSPEEALQIAIFLNDKYSIDGRDPNGYTGIAWSIGGVHDRPWAERPIFGKIRYMNDKGLVRKFNMQPYVAKWLSTSNKPLFSN